MRRRPAIHLTKAARPVVVVLPPGEVFSPGRAGAVGLLVHRLCQVAGGEVMGAPVASPFGGVVYHGAPPAFGLSEADRYAAGVEASLRPLLPCVVEVHNGPEAALQVARRNPMVMLFLHDDPQGMRALRTAGHRRSLLRGLSRVVTVSDYVRQRLLEGVPAELASRVTVMPHSIDVPRQTRRVRERLILFAGSIAAASGADAFIDACEAIMPHLPAWRAEMVGPDGDGASAAALRARAAAAGITLLGDMFYSAATERMSRAAIVVVPSRVPEPSGLVALEAMSRGAALVCSHYGALPEVAGPAAVYVDPDAPGDVGACLLSLASDDYQRQALVAAGRDQAAGFDTAVAAAQLRALREELAAAHPAESGGWGWGRAAPI